MTQADDSMTDRLRTLNKAVTALKDAQKRNVAGNQRFMYPTTRTTLECLDQIVAILEQLEHFVVLLDQANYELRTQQGKSR